MRKFGFLFAAGLALLVFNNSALAGGVINFDSAGGTNTLITSQFNSDNAEFSSGANAAVILADPSEASSVPNILVGNKDTNPGDCPFCPNVDQWDSTQPITIEVVTASGDPATTNAVCMTLISVGDNEVTATALDGLFGVVDSVSVQHLGSGTNGNGFAEQDPIILFDSSFQSSIASVDLVMALVSDTDGYGIDDVQVGCDTAKLSGKLALGGAGKRGSHALSGFVWLTGGSANGQVSINYKDGIDTGESPVSCVFEPNSGSLTIVGGTATLQDWEYTCDDTAASSGTATLVLESAPGGDNNSSGDKDRGAICVDADDDGLDISDGGGDCGSASDLVDLVNGNVIVTAGTVTAD